MYNRHCVAASTCWLVHVVMYQGTLVDESTAVLEQSELTSHNQLNGSIEKMLHMATHCAECICGYAAHKLLISANTWPQQLC